MRLETDLARHSPVPRLRRAWNLASSNTFMVATPPQSSLQTSRACGCGHRPLSARGRDTLSHRESARSRTRSCRQARKITPVASARDPRLPAVPPAMRGQPPAQNRVARHPGEARQCGVRTARDRAPPSAAHTRVAPVSERERSDPAAATCVHGSRPAAHRHLAARTQVRWGHRGRPAWRKPHPMVQIVPFLQAAIITCAAFRPGMPEIPAVGCVPEPLIYSPLTGVS